jgi:hypothetical protein
MVTCMNNDRDGSNSLVLHTVALDFGGLLGG